MSSNKLFVGNLSSRVQEADLTKLFEPFGKIVSVTIKQKNEKFAFVEFEDARDAQDAFKDLNGTEFFERSIRVEISTGVKKSASDFRGGSGRDGGTQRSNECFNCHQTGHYAMDCPEQMISELETTMLKNSKKQTELQAQLLQSQTDAKFANNRYQASQMRLQQSMWAICAAHQELIGIVSNKKMAHLIDDGQLGPIQNIIHELEALQLKITQSQSESIMVCEDSVNNNMEMILNNYREQFKRMLEERKIREQKHQMQKTEMKNQVKNLQLMHQSTGIQFNQFKEQLQIMTYEQKQSILENNIDILQLQKISTLNVDTYFFLQANHLLNFNKRITKIQKEENLRLKNQIQCLEQEKQNHEQQLKHKSSVQQTLEELACIILTRSNEELDEKHHSLIRSMLGEKVNHVIPSSQQQTLQTHCQKQYKQQLECDQIKKKEIKIKNNELMENNNIQNLNCRLKVVSQNESTINDENQSPTLHKNTIKQNQQNLNAFQQENNDLLRLLKLQANIIEKKCII